MSVVSTKADVVACSGSSVDLIRTIDYSPFFCRAVLNCFPFSQLDLPKMMHKTSYSVFGHIDLFSVLRAWAISHGESQSADWFQRCPELAHVSIFYVSKSKCTNRRIVSVEEEIPVFSHCQIANFLFRPLPVVSWGCPQGQLFVKN